MHSFANIYGAFDVVLYFVIIQLFWLLINLLLILQHPVVSLLQQDTECNSVSAVAKVLADVHPSSMSEDLYSQYNQFYNNLGKVMDKCQFSPQDIHNTGESGSTTVESHRML